MTSQTTDDDALDVAIAGRAIALRLSAGASSMEPEASERLRAARTRAVAVRKRAPLSTARSASANTDGTVTLGGLWWMRFALAASLVTLVVGLVGIHQLQQDRRATEAAEVDVAILTDDLPPSAFTDAGFAQFVKLRGDPSQN